MSPRGFCGWEWGANCGQAAQGSVSSSFDHETRVDQTDHQTQTFESSVSFLGNARTLAGGRALSFRRS